MKELNEIRAFGSPQAAIVVEGPKDMLEHLVTLIEYIPMVHLESLTQKELEALREFQVDEKINLAIV